MHEDDHDIFRLGAGLLYFLCDRRARVGDIFFRVGAEKIRVERAEHQYPRAGAQAALPMTRKRQGGRVIGQHPGKAIALEQRDRIQQLPLTRQHGVQAEPGMGLQHIARLDAVLLIALAKDIAGADEQRVDVFFPQLLEFGGAPQNAAEVALGRATAGFELAVKVR